MKLIPKPRMEGADVRELQTLLNEHGIACDVDGIFGPATDAAVRAFQGASGLAVDGIAGPKTWEALRRKASTSGAFSSYYGICTGGSVNVRAGGSTAYRVLGVAHKNDRLLVQPGKGWPQVAAVLHGSIVVGYMSGKYIRRLDNAL